MDNKIFKVFKEKNMKKITLIMVTVVLCAAMLAGCSTPAADTDYMSWTGTEWNAATDAEKFTATEAVLLAIGDSIMDNYTQLVETAKTDETVKAQIDAQVTSLQGTIDRFFESSPAATLNDLVEASKQAAAGLAG